MWHDNALTRRLGLRYPIIQGPFGGGLSSVELLVAVSEAGGLGSFGVHHLDAGQIRALAGEIRARTRKPFGFNLWVSNEDPEVAAFSAADFEAARRRFLPYYEALQLPPPSVPARFSSRFEDQIEGLLDAQPAVFSFVFGIPPRAVLDECRRRGILSFGTATTVDEALALEAAGVDAVIATGFEAGGHRVSFLRRAEDSLHGSLALIPMVADRLSIPVIAAGGIADGRGIAAALTLGAQAVQIGTAFLACAESNASDVHRRALFSDAARHTVLTRAFSGRLARGIRNRFTDDWQTRGDEILPYPIQNWFTGSFRAAATAQDRPELMSLWASQASPLLRERQAGALFAALVRDTERLLGGRTAATPIAPDA